MNVTPHYCKIRKLKRMRRLIKSTEWKFDTNYPVISMMTEQVMMTPQPVKKRAAPIPNAGIAFEADLDADDEDFEMADPKPIKVCVVKFLVANPINGEYLWLFANEVRFSGLI